MADAFAFSQRRLPNAQGRLPHSPRPPPATCVDVQWTFLPPEPHPSKPQSPHQWHNGHNEPQRLADRFDNADAREELQAEQSRLRAAKEAADLKDQRALYDLMGETQRQALLDKVMAEMEAMALAPVRRLASPRRGRHQHLSPQPTITPATRRASVLPTTTTGGAMPRDMELLPQRRLSALSSRDITAVDTERPHVNDGSSDGSSTDDDDNNSDDDAERGDHAGADIPELHEIRDRQRRRTACKSAEQPGRNSETHIRWQKTARVCVALDLPAAFLDDADEEEEEEEGDNCEARELRRPSDYDPLEELFPLSEEAVQETHRRRSMRSVKKKKKKKEHKVRSNAGSPPRSPNHQEDREYGFKAPEDPKSPMRLKKAAYGSSWYVPRDEWWPLHQTQQETLAELFPHDVPPPVERHRCEPRGSPNQRRPHPKDALAAAQQQPTHPHAWPSLLRSPAASSRVVPLVRAAPMIAAPPPTSHSVRSPRSSATAYATTPPATSSRIHTAQTVVARAMTSPRASLTTAGTVTVGNAPASAVPDAVAQRAAELQREIPNAYIAREFREYLNANGARVPSYLNY